MEFFLLIEPSSTIDRLFFTGNNTIMVNDTNDNTNIAPPPKKQSLFPIVLIVIAILELIYLAIWFFVIIPTLSNEATAINISLHSTISNILLIFMMALSLFQIYEGFRLRKKPSKQLKQLSLAILVLNIFLVLASASVLLQVVTSFTSNITSSVNK